eukprot:TRINITY_DN1812_c0_g1_i2.p1 TRINITY_DN1812_c0_g1~~TRINITY_DN1812_c0_g1_i2.p1  ORF type:complete len:598 (-),score=108.09 TRINITY_DN1812_c0_g1_i2:38-1831(-)
MLQEVNGPLLSDLSSIMIESNSVLVSLNALSNVHSTSVFKVTDNPRLKYLPNSLRNLGEAQISGNTMLESLSLLNITSTSQTTISENTALKSLELSGTFSSFIEIGGNNYLNSLRMDVTTGGPITITGTKCKTMNLSVKNSPALIIIGNTRLTNIVTEKSIVTDALTIRQNPLLQTLPTINYTTVDIQDNMLLCDQIGDNGFDCCGDGEISVYNLEICDNITSCKFGCDDCRDRYYGLDCIPCKCQNGFCDYGIRGSGKCVSCYSGYYGENCDKNCTCERGICNEGLNGDGKCSICFTNYYGENCQDYCYCEHGDCDYRTGVCNECEDDYFGTNCNIPIDTSQIVFPVVNCVEKIDSNYIYFLGYANAGEKILSEDVGSTIWCGNQQQSIAVPEYLEHGQVNFQLNVTCNGFFSWILNGTQISINVEERNNMLCSSTDQKLVIKAKSIDMVKLQTKLDSLYAEPPVITKIENKTDTTDDEILITFPKDTEYNGQALYDLSQLQYQNVIEEISSSSSEASSETLTFNEAVGLNIFSLRPQSDNNDAINNTEESINESTNLTIFVVILTVIIVLMIIGVIIVLFVKPIKNTVFPYRDRR